MVKKFVDKTEKFLARLRDECAVLVRVVATRGSAPREPGAWMAVFVDAVLGSVGGGQLELQAIHAARQRLGTSGWESQLHFALGPALGQCCGGAVQLRFEAVAASDSERLRSELQPPRYPVALFGAGHVGHALVRVLEPLPFRLTWMDSRDGVFPSDMPLQVTFEHSDPLQAGVAALASGSRVLVMSFSHAEDLEVLTACLLRQRLHADLPYIGLIGSRSKWASFRKGLQARGFTPQELDHVTCPIGVPGVPGKQPEVIAVAVAAQLLLTCAGSTTQKD